MTCKTKVNYVPRILDANTSYPPTLTSMVYRLDTVDSVDDNSHSETLD